MTPANERPSADSGWRCSGYGGHSSAYPRFRRVDRFIGGQTHSEGAASSDTRTIGTQSCGSQRTSGRNPAAASARSDRAGYFDFDGWRENRTCRYSKTGRWPDQFTWSMAQTGLGWCRCWKWRDDFIWSRQKSPSCEPQESAQRMWKQCTFWTCHSTSAALSFRSNRFPGVASRAYSRN